VTQVRRRKNTDPDQPSQTAALTWLSVGVASRLAFFVLATSSQVDKPLSLVVIYLLAVVCLDLFVGGSRKVALQRIAPGVVLAMLVTPGIPPSVALVADLIGSLAVASTSRITWQVIADGGKALLPATITATFLATRPEMVLDTYFFATEIFLVASLLTRTTIAPFRSDLFLVVSYPAIALMLRSLAELHLAYVLLAVPLLFLMTTVDTDRLLRYFQLQKKLDESQSQIKETRRAQRVSEIESRRKGILLHRREQQLSLLNGLGREMDAAQASEDLGRFLLKESMRMTNADCAVILFSDDPAGRIEKVISSADPPYWGIKEGDRVPGLVRPGIRSKEPWPAPLWRDMKCVLTSPLGNEGWLFLGSAETDHFPDFLEEFFSAVGRHAGSAVLALRRLTEVRATAHREALEKEKVATEKEKVAEQNRNLRLLIENFEGLTEGALSSDHELLRQGSLAIKRITWADEVVFKSRELSDYPLDESGVLVEGTRWPSYIFLKDSGPSGNLLCLSRQPNGFAESQIEWCSLLKEFLDKTLENGALHREVQSSYAQLERTQEEVVLSSQWAAAGRLAANAAHELNTPLGAIRLAAEQASFFLKPESTPEPAIQSLQSIVRSVDRCRQVTDRLLITSRPVDQGETVNDPEDQALLPVLKDAVASVQPYLRASNILLADHRMVGDFTVSVVLQDLYWAFVNILKNGVDALNENGPAKKQMAIAVAPAGEFIEVRIADNGPGIEPEFASRVFEPFFTTKKLGQGNGLGLSLSRTNLRRWGGDIELEETPGGGATFILTIPRAKGS
jgi:signal transduction histidine kinase